MIIKPLKEFPEYEEIIADNLFSEWNELYTSKTLYKTKQLLLDNYIKKAKIYFVAFDPLNKEFIGCYTFYKSLFKYFLADVYIHPKYRKQGYGSKMIKQAIEYAKDHHNDLYLYTDKNELIKFYTKIGFKLDNYHDSLDRTRMIINLKSSNYKLIILIVILILIFLIMF